MTSLCFWNIRGIRQSQKQRDIKNILHQFKPVILGLVEVKINYTRIEKMKLQIWRKAGHFFATSRSGRVRIWLL